MESGELPIAFMSKKLNKSHRNYSVTEQECLETMLSITKFRTFIEGHKFTVITDLTSSKWHMSQSNLSSKPTRWALKLQGFQFKIEHRKGTQNIVPHTHSPADFKNYRKWKIFVSWELTRGYLLI